jgi:carboxymethylenebutenolidase
VSTALNPRQEWIGTTLGLRNSWTGSRSIDSVLIRMANMGPSAATIRPLDGPDDDQEGSTVCFDADSHPPIAPIAGGALDTTELTLTAADGNRLTAFLARAAVPTGAGIVILPDIRGLHAYYEELALRFAENGIDAIAFDWFGRTAGLGRREEGFEHMPHVMATTWPGVSADIVAATGHLRSVERAPTEVFTVGFCFGGRLSFLAGTLGLGLAGVVGFYGSPVGPARNGSPEPVALAGRIASPLLGLFGGADEGIPPDAIAAFDTALDRAGVDHRLVSYPGAPHSFFDKKAADFAEASEGAWAEILAFIASHRATGPVVAT